eukprot:1179868-Prorocentrum_minimum.AAC.7
MAICTKAARSSQHVTMSATAQIKKKPYFLRLPLLFPTPCDWSPPTVYALSVSRDWSPPPVYALSVFRDWFPPPVYALSVSRDWSPPPVYALSVFRDWFPPPVYALSVSQDWFPPPAEKARLESPAAYDEYRRTELAPNKRGEAAPVTNDSDVRDPHPPTKRSPLMGIYIPHPPTKRSPSIGIYLTQRPIAVPR